MAICITWVDNNRKKSGLAIKFCEIRSLENFDLYLRHWTSMLGSAGIGQCVVPFRIITSWACTLLISDNYLNTNLLGLPTFFYWKIMCIKHPPVLTVCPNNLQPWQTDSQTLVFAEKTNEGGGGPLYVTWNGNLIREEHLRGCRFLLGTLPNYSAELPHGPWAKSQWPTDPFIRVSRFELG